MKKKKEAAVPFHIELWTAQVLLASLRASYQSLTASERQVVKDQLRKV